MPQYLFRCPFCINESICIVPMNTETPPCPVCNKPMNKQWSLPAHPIVKGHSAKNGYAYREKSDA